MTHRPCTPWLRSCSSMIAASCCCSSAFMSSISMSAQRASSRMAPVLSPSCSHETTVQRGRNQFQRQYRLTSHPFAPECCAASFASTQENLEP